MIAVAVLIAICVLLTVMKMTVSSIDERKRILTIRFREPIVSTETIVTVLARYTCSAKLVRFQCVFPRGYKLLQYEIQLQDDHIPAEFIEALSHRNDVLKVECRRI